MTSFMRGWTQDASSALKQSRLQSDKSGVNAGYPLRANGGANMHRAILLPFFVAVVVPSAFSQTASAAAPTFEQNIPPFPIVVEGVCPFPFLIESFQTNEIIKTFSNGRQIITGVWKLRTTNLDTGNSIILRISGPTVARLNADGTTTVILLGRSADTIVEGGTPVPVNNAGRIIETFDQEGNLVSTTLIGHQFPSCNF